MERKVERKVEQSTEKKLDDVLENKQRNKPANFENFSEEDANQFLKMSQELQAGMADAKFEKSYTFTQKTVSVYESTEGKRKEKSEITQHYGDQAMMMSSSQEPKTKIITDFKNQSSIVLNDKDKTATAISLGFMKQMGAMAGQKIKDDIPDNPMKFNKTGNTRTIAGYSCDEYVGEDESTSVRMWCSKKADIGAERYAVEMGKLFGFDQFPKDWNTYGAMLRFESIDKKTKDKAEMEIKSVEKVNTSIQTSAYKFTKM